MPKSPRSSSKFDFKQRIRNLAVLDERASPFQMTRANELPLETEVPRLPGFLAKRCMPCVLTRTAVRLTEMTVDFGRKKISRG